MQLYSFQYILFLFLVVLLFWRLPQRFHKLLLLIASYWFYMSWMPAWGGILLVITTMNYCFGIKLASSSGGRRAVFLILLIFNLAILLLYKYAGFILENFQGLLGKLSGAPVADPGVLILAPLGISFFTFCFIHYSTEVYRGRPPVRSWLDFALYASFFPTLISGPIKRYDDFIPQLSVRPVFREDDFLRGIWLLIRGLFKKIVLADNLAVAVTAGFGAPGDLGAIDAWVVAIAYTLQIYFDFSGYTDMARGSAALLGYRIPENFNLPYLSVNIADFWRRWHITLSSWLRDYLYIPLGGSRCGRFRNHLNLLVTMTLAGLWHGAAWTFAFWGIFHGIGLIVHREWRRYRVRFRPIGHPFLRRSLSVAVTFCFVSVAWIFFRAHTIEDAWTILRCMMVQGPSGLMGHLNTDHWITVILIGLSYPFYLRASKWLLDDRRLPWIRRRIWLAEPGWAALMLLAVLAFPGGQTAFVYFTF
jgi:alginate O-acetyltransferase complex protein AlgI